MEGMEPDAASGGVVDGRGEQVVEVDEHGEQHHEPGSRPRRAEEQRGDEAGHGDVEGEV
jgi:hypothetical protein